MLCLVASSAAPSGGGVQGPGWGLQGHRGWPSSPRPQNNPSQPLGGPLCAGATLWEQQQGLSSPPGATGLLPPLATSGLGPGSLRPPVPGSGARAV